MEYCFHNPYLCLCPHCLHSNTSRKLAKHNVQLPEDCVGPGRMCARCGNQWSDGNYQLHLKPQRLANNAKRRRLIAQLDVIKAKQPKGSGRLSTAARKRAKWIKKRMCSGVVSAGNSLSLSLSLLLNASLFPQAVDCAVCKHKTLLPLEKPKKRSKSDVTSETIPTTTTTVTPETAKKKMKKKKKQAPNNNNKDINAGLKLAKPQKQQQTTPTAAAAAPTKTPSKAAATTKTTATTTAAATAAKSNKQKKKSKTAQSKATPTPTPTPAAKVQSKTQKQNALLQLAAQLKLHASKNASKTQQNRLQAFLK